MDYLEQLGASASSFKIDLQSLKQREKDALKKRFEEEKASPKQLSDEAQREVEAAVNDLTSEP